MKNPSNGNYDKFSFSVLGFYFCQILSTSGRDKLYFVQLADISFACPCEQRRQDTIAGCINVTVDNDDFLDLLVLVVVDCTLSVSSEQVLNNCQSQPGVGLAQTDGER